VGRANLEWAGRMSPDDDRIWLGKANQAIRAGELRSAKTKMEKIMARYRQLHKRHQPSRDAAEMARLAEQLRQCFEAKAFLTVAIAADPDRVDLRRDLARLHERSDSIGGSGRTLAQLIAPELGNVSSP